MKYLFITLAVLTLAISCKKKEAESEPAKNTAPVVTTSDVTVFTQETATFGGNVTSDGGLSVTERGVCWSITPNPTKANPYMAAVSTGTGTFTISVTNLKLGTKYYVRAYAVNSAGISYGDEKSFTTVATLAIGLHYQGGIICYLDGTLAHGYICAEADNGTNKEWGCQSMKISNAMGTEVGKGLSNTSAIVSACGEQDRAAYICSNLDQGGYSDWFLPSVDELTMIYNNLAKDGKGGFTQGQYWSSTQSPTDNMAQVVAFNDGHSQHNGKNSMLYVRAMRSF